MVALIALATTIIMRY